MTAAAGGGSVRLGSDRRRVAMLPDTPSFDPWLTGWEVVDLARALVAPGAPAVGVGRVLADAGLAEAAARRVGGYSRGMLQRLGLAATVVGDPEVLLLDEPCSALDPAGRREVLDLVARLSGQVTVLLSTHILADVQQVCDTVGVLRAGRLLYQGSLDELLVGRADWLPSHLVGSLHVLARGGDPGEFLPAAAVTLALGALAVAAANWRLGRRDV